LPSHNEVRDPEATQRRVFHQVHDVAEEATHQAPLGPVVATWENVRLDHEFHVQAVEEVLDLFLGINPHVRREVIAHYIVYTVGKDRQVARSVVLSSEKEAMRLEGIQA